MLRELVHLEDTEMRVAVLGERMRGGASAAVAALDALVGAALAGDGDARQVAVALAIWRARLDDDALLGRLRQAAGEAPRVAPLLEATTHGRRSLPRGARIEPTVARRRLAPMFRRQVLVYTDDESGRVVSTVSWFGHQRHLATEARPRLLLGVEPEAVPRLLEEPTLDLRSVVALAAHRPAATSVVRAVASSARWMRHVEVREALASNPYAPPPLVYALLPSLPRAAWPL